MNNDLQMRQDVFGSVFRGSRLSRRTRMVVESKLIIPSSAVEITYDEMEYVDGGVYVETKWWGLRVVLNGSETTSLATGQAVVATAITTALGFSGVGAVLGAVIGAGFALQAITINEYNRNGSGVYLDYNWLQVAQFPLNPLVFIAPIIRDRY